jgi:hypothetical protein
MLEDEAIEGTGAAKDRFQRFVAQGKGDGDGIFRGIGVAPNPIVTGENIVA